MVIEAKNMTPLLQVYDMPTAVRFYRDRLGFAIVNTSAPLGGEDRFHWCWLRLGEADLMLNSAYEFDGERPSREEHERTRDHGDTCLYLACPDVDGAYAELLARGVEATAPKVAAYGMKQVYLRDPDGFLLCLQWRVE